MGLGIGSAYFGAGQKSQTFGVDWGPEPTFGAKSPNLALTSGDGQKIDPFRDRADRNP